MYWSEDDWAEDTLSLSTFREASLMFRTYYGEVIAEAGKFNNQNLNISFLDILFLGKTQEFSCELEFDGEGNDSGEFRPSSFSQNLNLAIFIKKVKGPLNGL